MKLLFAAVNAKYVHTNLAMRYLKKVSEDLCQCELKEYSINDNILSVERDIVLSKPDIVAFSCYIWNVSFILTLADNIKKAMPECIVVFGGPEVSYDTIELLDKHTFIDYVIKGEGEVVFPSLINHIVNGTDIPQKGLSYRINNDIIDTPWGISPDFSQIPFPYTKEELKELSGRIIYYESSRGCPYSCKYCLSGEKGRVRFKDVESVLTDLKFFSDNRVSLVKFVDRTFNADKKRALAIWKGIAKLNTNTRFHMEITGEILDEDTLKLLQDVNPENLQFEIGVQSTNPQTLDAIDRKCKVEKLFENITYLLKNTDIHIHLDLIAGLPYEDFASFKKSFNDVVSLRPHVLQLGFLKLLKGSAMRDESSKYNMVYRNNAPYEIISNEFLSCEEIFFLKDVDYVFDKFYNSGSFSKTIGFLFEKYNDRFEIFADIVKYFRNNNLINTSLSKQRLYDVLYECFSDFGTSFEEALRYDIIYSMHIGKLPYWCNTDNNFTSSQEVYDFLKDEDAKLKIIPHMTNIPAKSIIKHIRIEKFSYGILLFDYKNDTVYDVTDFIKSEN
ncbi:MAG: DUF4080 domain-containing protein [Clostridia bacterium]|nr:DUF4080 domain-containing protein [Clostridia bacterium]